MAITLTADWLCQLKWNYQDTLDLGTAKFPGDVVWSFSNASGTGNNQADRFWADERTLATTATETLDLTALPGSPFGSLATTNFAKVKGLWIFLPASGITTSASGEDLIVGNAAAAPFLGPMLGTTPRQRVYSGNPLMWPNKLAGWSTSGANNLKIENAGLASIVYRILILGTSA